MGSERGIRSVDPFNYSFGITREEITVVHKVWYVRGRVCVFGNGLGVGIGINFKIRSEERNERVR